MNKSNIKSESFIECNKESFTPSCWDCFTVIFNTKKLYNVVYNPSMSTVESRCGIWQIGFL